MESPASGRRRIEDMSKEDLLEIIQKLKTYSQQATSDKKSAEEANAQITREKEEIREKAMALLKRCRELEGKVEVFESSLSSVTVGQNDSIDQTKDKEEGSSTGGSASPSMQEQERLLTVISVLEDRYATLQTGHNQKIAEALASAEECATYKNQGIALPL
jgi:hypothetical protein